MDLDAHLDGDFGPASEFDSDERDAADVQYYDKAVLGNAAVFGILQDLVRRPVTLPLTGRV